MNLRLLTLSAAASAVLTAVTPMVPASMSTDNGGTKSAIDAYSDGGGVVIINQAGDTKLDNSAMNSLVFKYGQTAEDSGTTLKNQVSVLSADTTVAEKAISVKLDLAKAVIDAPVNGTSCDDGDPQTNGDVWENGSCSGLVAYTSCLDILTKNPTAANGTYTVRLNGETVPSSVYCDMKKDGGGWTLFYYANNGVDETLNGTNTSSLTGSGANININIKNFSQFSNMRIIAGRYIGVVNLSSIGATSTRVILNNSSQNASVYRDTLFNNVWSASIPVYFGLDLTGGDVPGYVSCNGVHYQSNHFSQNTYANGIKMYSRLGYDCTTKPNDAWGQPLSSTTPNFNYRAAADNLCGADKICGETMAAGSVWFK